MADSPSASHAGDAIEVGWRRRLWHRFIRSRIPFKATLARAYLRALERHRSREPEPAVADEFDGIAVPPARLRVLVAGIPGRDWFLDSGRAQTNYLRELLAQVGSPVGEMDAILDWGCGCGRMTRWWADLGGPEIHGCDYNGELVDWCDRNLPFAEVRTTELTPPLPYADGAFDFVYAFSVFTHLSIVLAREWLAELARIVKPGGFVWFTVHGASYRARLPVDQQRCFDAGEIVVWLPEIEGTNLCAAYWPDAAVAGMVTDRFELVAHLDAQADAARAQTAQLAPHDAYLIRRR